MATLAELVAEWLHQLAWPGAAGQVACGTAYQPIGLGAVRRIGRGKALF